MKPRDLVFVALIVIVVGGLFYLSQRARTPRAMPINDAHRNASTREQCLSCHKAETFEALEKAHKHPGKWRDEKISCLQCHIPISKPGKAQNLLRDKRTQSLLAALNSSKPSTNSPR